LAPEGDSLWLLVEAETGVLRKWDARECKEMQRNFEEWDAMRCEEA
jgi:hypothetical protein